MLNRRVPASEGSTMKSGKAATKSNQAVMERPPAEALEGWNPDTSFLGSNRIGTLSFPVCNAKPIYDNTGLIDEIIKKRHPALLLCAGWSVPTEQSLDTIIGVSRTACT